MLRVAIVSVVVATCGLLGILHQGCIQGITEKNGHNIARIIMIFRVFGALNSSLASSVRIIKRVTSASKLLFSSHSSSPLVVSEPK